MKILFVATTWKPLLLEVTLTSFQYNHSNVPFELLPCHLHAETKYFFVCWLNNFKFKFVQGRPGKTCKRREQRSENI